MRFPSLQPFQPHFALGIVFAVGIITSNATPLQARFTSCLGNYNAANVNDRMIVSDVYANLVSSSEAIEQGLIGDGHDVLRVDLLGTAGSTVNGYDNSTNKLATLFTDTSTAHISVYESTTWLCNSIFPPDLPTAYYPFNTTYCPLAAGPFALNLSIPLYRSYALTTLRTQVRVVDTSLNALTLACYEMEFTPYDRDGWYYDLFLYLPIALAIGFWTVTWAARFATGWIVGSGVAEYGQKDGHNGSRITLPMGTKREATMRKWGTMLISGLSGERLSVSSALLRFVTPGLKDILYYIQFCTLLGMIAVNWPAFAYPILAQGGWADLVWNMTLVQGSNPDEKRVDTYPGTYTAPSEFADMMNDPTYPLYLESDSFNPLLDIQGRRDGMESWAAAVGLRPQDLFGTCLVVFLCLALGIFIISLGLWIIHGLFEYTSSTVALDSKRQGNRSSWHGSPQASLGGKEAYEPRSYGWDAEGPQLPTQASLAAHSSAPNKLRKTWLRFRPKGEAGAFHAAALYGNLLRLIMTFHLPITTFSIYQLAHSSGSIVSKVFAALAFAFISLAIPAGILIKINRTPSGKLYDATRTLLSLGPFYNVYIEHKQMYRAVLLSASLIEGVVVGAGQQSGIAQAIIFVLVELALLIIPAIWYPWGEGASMGAPSAFIGIIRVACAVLVMLLSRTLDMGEPTNDWIAYSILILHAIVFVFFTFMLLTKLVEGVIRLLGGAHFDESTSPLDSGLFAAIMDLDCLNGVRGGKAAQRKRRKRGSRQLQRNVSAAGSLTTQMMLDRHSQGVSRQPISEGSTPFLNPYPPHPQQRPTSYFPGYQPPLGPPPLERHSSDSRSDEPSASGHIMDAWRPAQPVAYNPTGYIPAPLSSPGESSSVPTRSFSVVRGGRADYQNPYDVQAGSPTRSLSPPALRIASPSKPSHTRQHSSSAIVERYDGSAPSSPRLGHNAPTLYPPGRDGPRPNNEGLRPPQLAIPKRRSLNNLKDDPSPDSTSTPRRGKRKSKTGGWFGKSAEDPESSPAEESDDEPGPSRRRVPLHFEPAPSPLGEKKSWRTALGLGRKKSMDEMAELARDENKARKAALAAASGSMFAGVEAPPSKSFVVNRKNGSRPGGPTPLQSPVSATSETKSFKVKRMGQPVPSASGSASPATNPKIQITSVAGSSSLDRTEKGERSSGGFKVIGRPTLPSSQEVKRGSGSGTVNRPQTYRSTLDDSIDFTKDPNPSNGTGYPPTVFVPMRDDEAGKRLSGGTFGSLGSRFGR